VSEARRSSQTWIWFGALFLVLGLLGHVFAAQAIGGSRIAYTHHVFGFFVGLVFFGAVATALGMALLEASSGHHAARCGRGAGVVRARGVRSTVPHRLSDGRTDHAFQCSACGM
jgi:hypothetical protein